MSSIDINSVLSQIRSLNQAASARPAVPLAPEMPSVEGTAQSQGGFASLMRQGIDSVAGAQNQAGALQKAFEMGDPNTDLASVMVASARAQVSFRAMVEVRNRVVNAYQEVMNMPM
jgi:flagellar hook-basal body complex protein FliE